MPANVGRGYNKFFRKQHAKNAETDQLRARTSSSNAMI